MGEIKPNFMQETTEKIKTKTQHCRTITELIFPLSKAIMV